MKDWHVYQVAIGVIRMLRGPVKRIRQRDLAEQILRAANSVPLNLSEGNRRVGKDRLHHFRIAAGSADEVRAAIDVAEAWGDLDGATAARIHHEIDRVLAMLHRMTH